jgi:UDP-N-acetylmuramate--alanine ligase
LDIYPARELPIEGVTSEIIFNDVTIENKVLIHKEEVLDTLEKRELDVVITFGAGDIDRLIPSIKELLQNKTR